MDSGLIEILNKLGMTEEAKEIGLAEVRFRAFQSQFRQMVESEIRAEISALKRTEKDHHLLRNIISAENILRSIFEE